VSNCPKCGTKVREDMTFCPNCGAALKAAPPPAAAAPPTPPPAAPRGEKAEKGEKGEKREKREKEEREEREKKEKGEKYEKREYGFIGPLVGGLILIFLGLMIYVALTTPVGWGIIGAFFVIIIGIIILAGAIYAATMATRKHPRT